MKNKIVTTIIGIIFSMFLNVTFAIPTYATGNIEANVILQKDANTDNKINISLETSQDQSIASFNISLIVETANVQDIKNVKMDWNSDISNNSELKEVTYGNGKINIYVVSKNELGNNNENQRRIDIGTITIETENRDNMSIIIKAQKDLTRIASIGNETATITNDISTMVQLQIAPRVSDGNQGGDNTQGGNGNQGGNNEQAGNGNQSGNGTQVGDNGQDGNVIPGEDDILNGDSNQVNDDSKPNDKDVMDDNKNTNTDKENLAQGELPKAGVTISNIIIFSIIAIGVLILITVIIVKAKARKSKHIK